MGELSDHELKPILVKGSQCSYRTPFLGKCYFEQKEGAPHEVDVPLCSTCAAHTGISRLRGLHNSASIPPSLGDHRLPDYKLHSTQLFTSQSGELQSVARNESKRKDQEAYPQHAHHSIFC